MLLLGVIILGTAIGVRGVTLWGQTNTGTFIQNWITPSSQIPGKSYMWTWGVGSNPRQEPDLWHFHVIFVANDTADVLLLWNLNESVLFERSSARIDETFDVALPRTSVLWRWDWLIRNPHETGLTVENFTVSHYPVSFPERQNGIIAITAGVALIIAASVGLIYFRRVETRRRRRR
jgi:hypothetical protein